jgi:hypothetical protein
MSLITIQAINQPSVTRAPALFLNAWRLCPLGRRGLQTAAQQTVPKPDTMLQRTRPRRMQQQQQHLERIFAHPVYQQNPKRVTELVNQYRQTSRAEIEDRTNIGLAYAILFAAFIRACIRYVEISRRC